jgi:restriction system protein
MTPSQFEALVAAHLGAQGYEVEDRPPTNDWGLDIIATSATERVGVQVKMYGGSSRPVNRAQIMQLFGAAAFFDCSRSLVVTNGVLLPDAEAVAAKLGVEVLYLAADPAAVRTVGRSAFDDIWERHVMPLAGRTLTRTDGSSNVIESVDWTGLERVTSNGRRQRINIEIFRYAIERVLAEGRVARADINAEYPGRASSGIVLILSQIPGWSYDGRYLTGGGPHENRP